MQASLPTGPALARLAGCLLLVSLASACGKKDAAPEAPAARTLFVEMGTAETRNVDVTLDSVGTAYASGQVDIRPQVTGTLLQAPFVEGGPVEQGQILIQLDDSKPRASLALSQAQLDSAKAKLSVASERLGRARSLKAEQLVSREEFATLDSEQKAAAAAVRENEAEVRLAQRNLEDYTLRAPITGRMGIRYVDEGNLVEAGTIISTLVADDPLEILFTLPGASMEGVHVGQDAEVRATDATKTLLGTAKVRVIDARVDAKTRMINVKAVIANPDTKIKAGQFVAISLVRERRSDAVVVPEDAVIPYAGKTYLYVVKDGQASRREVVLGVRLPEVVEVSSGLTAGETIVTRGQHRLGDGAKVEQRKADDDKPATPAQN